MKRISKHSNRSHIQSSALVVALLAGVISLANSVAGTITRSDGRVTLFYPDNGPGSIGNQSVDSVFNTTGALTGNVIATAHVQETRSGTDANGTSGTATGGGTTISEMGRIQASNSASAFSSGAPNHPAPFPHGGSNVEATGKFNDSVFLTNPSYPGLIPVTLHLDMTWTFTHDLGVGGANFIQDLAVAQTGLQWLGSITSFNLYRSDVPTAQLQLSGTLSGLAPTSNWLDYFGNLNVVAGAVLNAQGTVSSPFANVSASSSADVRYWLEVPVGTTIHSESGHDYSTSGSQSVPDAASNVGLLCGGLFTVLFAGGRRHGQGSIRTR